MFLSQRTGMLVPYWVNAQVINNYITDVDDNDTQLPVSFHLHQNYPNPFNPTTNIEIDLKDAGNVKLNVFDSLGKVIAVIRNGYMEAGNYDFTFDGANLSSGVYFCNLSVDNKFNAVRKILLLK